MDEYQRVLVHPSVAARADGEHHPEKDPAPGPAHVSDVSARAGGSALLHVQQSVMAPVWIAQCTTRIFEAIAKRGRRAYPATLTAWHTRWLPAQVELSEAGEQEAS